MASKMATKTSELAIIKSIINSNLMMFVHIPMLFGARSAFKAIKMRLDHYIISK